MSAPRHNVDAAELAKFESLAARWWDPNGELKALHDINPLRLAFVEAQGPLAGLRVVDVGCGGGILAEAMARRGALVTAIDASQGAVEAARVHAARSGVEVDYRVATAEALAEEIPARFDVVTCMELLEHVPAPASVVAACARLARPDACVFFSTINRNLKAYALAVLGAEHVLGLLPKGTHDYAKFIRPSELDAWARAAGLGLEELVGLAYNPLTRRCRFAAGVDVNYLARLRAASAAD